MVSADGRFGAIFINSFGHCKITAVFFNERCNARACPQRGGSLGQAGVSVRLGREQNSQNPAKRPTRQHPRLRQTACWAQSFFPYFFPFFHRTKCQSTRTGINKQINKFIYIDLFFIAKYHSFIKLYYLCAIKILIVSFSFADLRKWTEIVFHTIIGQKQTICCFLTVFICRFQIFC